MPSIKRSFSPHLVVIYPSTGERTLMLKLVPATSLTRFWKALQSSQGSLVTKISKSVGSIGGFDSSDRSSRQSLSSSSAFFLPPLSPPLVCCCKVPLDVGHDLFFRVGFVVAPWHQGPSFCIHPLPSLKNRSNCPTEPENFRRPFLSIKTSINSTKDTLRVPTDSEHIAKGLSKG